MKFNRSVGRYASLRRPRTLSGATKKSFDSLEEYLPKVGACQCGNVERNRKAEVVQSNAQADRESLGRTFAGGLVRMAARHRGIRVRADA